MKKILLFILALNTTLLLAETKTSGSGNVNFNDANSWTPSGVPQSGDDIVIPDGSVLSVDVTSTVRSVEVQSGGFLFVNNNLTVSGSGSTNSSNAGDVTVAALLTFTTSNFTNTGSFTLDPGFQVIFKDTGSTISNTGTITFNSDSDSFSSLVYLGTNYSGNTDSVKYDRYVTTVSVGWDLIGSPVSGETAHAIASQGNIAVNGTEKGIGNYDNSVGSLGTWYTFTPAQAAGHGSLNSGVGYQMATATGATLRFEGNLVTGNVNVAITEGDSSGDSPSVTGTRFNLVANPYASYISANSNASGASSEGSDHVLNVGNLNKLHTNNQIVYLWQGTTDGYKSINSGTPAADAVIAPGQGFFVGGKYDDGDQDLIFNTDMLTEDGTDDAVENDMMDEDRGDLHLILSQNSINSEAVIYFLENTTDAFEPAYDGGVLDIGNHSISTRLVEGDEGIDLSIQSLAYSEMWDKIIPLNISALGGEEFTVSISHRTTPADLNIYLEDTEEGTMTNLLYGDYVLTPTSDLEGVGRFFIHMTADTMSNGEVSTSLLNAYKEIDASYITVEGLATQSNETNVRLYNILGREVLSTTLNNNMGTQTISTVGLSAGIYLIELESGTDRLTKKLLIQ